MDDWKVEKVSLPHFPFPKAWCRRAEYLQWKLQPTRHAMLSSGLLVPLSCDFSIDDHPSPLLSDCVESRSSSLGPDLESTKVP